jgi:hypothetical protein
VCSFVRVHRQRSKAIFSCLLPRAWQNEAAQRCYGVQLSLAPRDDVRTSQCHLDIVCAIAVPLVRHAEALKQCHALTTTQEVAWLWTRGNTRTIQLLDLTNIVTKLRYISGRRGSIASGKSRIRYRFAWITACRSSCLIVIIDGVTWISPFPGHHCACRGV